MEYFIDQVHKEAIDHELLCQSRERELLELAVQGDPDAISELVRCNQRMVYKEARRYYNTGICGDQEFEDIVQWGNIGLLKAIRKWDIAKGNRLTTYALPWIRSMIWRYGALSGCQYSISHDFNQRANTVKYAVSRLVNKLGREPSLIEISTEVGEDPNFVRQALAVRRPAISLDDNAGRDYAREIRANDCSVEEKSSFQSIASDLAEQIDTLPARWQVVIEMRYLKEMSYMDIGEALGVSKTRIQQIEHQALKRLRVHFVGHGLTFTSFGV